MSATSGKSLPPLNDDPSPPSRSIEAPSRSDVRRVLMTVDAVGGVWQYSLDLATAFRERGVATTLAVLGPQMDERQRAEIVGRGVDFVEASYKLEWFESPWEDIERAGDWLLAVEAALTPDVVHLNGFCHAVLPWKSPAVVVAHSCVRSWWRAVHGVAAPAEWDRYSGAVIEGLRAARLVIAPTLAMMSMLHDEYGEFGPWQVIPNGRALVDDAMDTVPLKSDVVFSAARLWDEAKNISALCSVAYDIPWRVVVAGDAGDTRVETFANVSWLGRADSVTMARWFARASIYAHPALYEPFGLSVLEAAASGCAMVLGEIASLRENWSDAAIFIDPLDRRALAAAIRGLIDDPFGRRQLAARAMTRARQFTVAKMARAYLEAYQRIPSHAAVV